MSFNSHMRVVQAQKSDEKKATSILGHVPGTEKKKTKGNLIDR